MVCGLTIFGKSAQAQIFEGLAAEKFLSGCELVRYTDRTPLPNFFVMRPGMEIPAGEIPQLLQKVYRLGNREVCNWAACQMMPWVLSTKSCSRHKMALKWKAEN